MTAEIVIMNREAVALAADSAVTFGEKPQKIFSSANKLFALSKYDPVGIMVYGQALFMEVPWETIIKIYRDHLRQSDFDTLKEYATDFINFLDNGNPMFPEEVQNRRLSESIYGYFTYIRNQIEEQVESKLSRQGEISDEETEKIVSSTIQSNYKIWGKTKNIPSIPETFNEDIIDKHKKTIDEAIEHVFEQLTISDNHLDKLRIIAGSLYSKFPIDIAKYGLSGIVIAGFGREDTFPALASFELEGVAENRLCYKPDKSREISFTINAYIIPFAQKEMVHTFMEGIDPDYAIIQEAYLDKVLREYGRLMARAVTKYTTKERRKLEQKFVGMSKKILKDYSERLAEVRKESYVRPITHVVAALPKDELAAMAESLVSLTSFKQKVSMAAETVGGPIDVAVISKGDGFVWIKKKHYFGQELNPRHMATHYGG